MIPEIGRRFGPYEIQGRLGGGGMGHVYRAWDERLHREVALKLLNHEFAMPGMRERFLREARAASALNHPNICTIFDIGEQDGDPYFVMELLQGETLRDRILNRSLAVEEMVSIARDAAEALGAAHSKGVVHRDVKPANIFLVEKPNGGMQAKVLDFGLAKIEGGPLGARSRSLEITSVGATVGTLAYMSPEQARGEPLDSRSDLFSLGVVMYEMATRQVPFQGVTSALVFVQLLNHAPEPIRSWNESVPRELEKVIFKLLAKERTARFQTARELELALIAIQEKIQEKGGGGGWLRKAVTAVPLVRASDPVARGRRASGQRTPTSISGVDSPRPAKPQSGEAAPRAGSNSDQVLRPVARVPRSATTQHGGGTAAAAAQASRSGDQTPEAARPIAGSAEASRADGVAPAPVARDASVTGQTEQLPASPSGPLRPLSTRERPGVAPVFPWDSHADFQQAFPQLLEPALEPGTVRAPLRRGWIVTMAVLLILGSIGLYMLLGGSRLAPPLLARNDAVALGDIENRSGDKALDGSVAAGLAMALAQSPHLQLRSGVSYLAAERLVQTGLGDQAASASLLARRTAQRLGAKAYLYGSISGSGAPYRLHLDLRQADSDQLLASIDERAESLQQVPGAIDQLAIDVRSVVGEPRSSIDRTSVPLESEATANLSALALYAQAQTLIATHEPLGAISLLQQAGEVEPIFPQAHLFLAELFRQMHAETAAAASAKQALAAAGAAGERTRTRAQASYEVNTTGDLVHATALLRGLVAEYPGDAESLSAMAGALVSQGDMAEALQAAEQGYAADPFCASAYSEAERALIGLDRFDAAFQLDQRAQRLGVAQADDSLRVAVADDRRPEIDDLSASIPQGRMEFRPDWSYGLLLDLQGRLSAGAMLWTSRAAAAERNESLRSASAFLLAQAAVDRALLADCPGALSMLRQMDEPVALPRGSQALFNSGMAFALCGEANRAQALAQQMLQPYPQNFAVNNFYLPDLRATLALDQRDPAAALELLRPARRFDLISLTPYLRGLAHIAVGENALGIVDLQMVLAHRGATFTIGDAVFPAAEIGVARAFAASGDPANSAAAYRRLTELWRNSDPQQVFLTEARLHADAGDTP